MMLDFSKKGGSSEAFSAEFNERIDLAVKADREANERKRDYLGGSRLGVECERRLGYEYAHAKPDAGKEFSGRLYRIFRRGADCEKRMAAYLQLGGFSLITEKEDGSQFGFYVAQDPETGRARIAGHIDGVIVGGPDSLAGVRLEYPMLWENKGVNSKSFAKYGAKGLQKANLEYYVQTQTYMAYMGLEQCLFTVENQDNCEIYPELVRFNLRDAQDASDKGVRIISAGAPEELPRIGKDRTDYRCKFCPFPDRCWSEPQKIVQAPKPAWLFGAPRV